MKELPMQSDIRHIPVLLHETIDNLALKPGAVVVDCNLGDGGHSEFIIKKLGGNVNILGFDLDTDAIARTQKYLEKSLSGDLAKNLSKSLIPINANFSLMDEKLAEKGYGENSVDAILFDLGLSTYDLIGSEKGFTFRKDEPLHMTFGPVDTYHFTARDIVNDWDAEDIGNVIYAYGEDRDARKIARAIVAYREKFGPIDTSKKLADLIDEKFGKRVPEWMIKAGRGPKTHPATKTFQALRIAVNNELEHLRIALGKAIALLKPGGILEVISYHSLEDRIVKQITKQWAKDGLAEEVVKKPIVPTEDELRSNPRSRSAKLRIVRKI
jgi:16S rRNA (cytosine1402-N4)-methyltransferase